MSAKSNLKYYALYYGRGLAISAGALATGAIIATPFILPETKGEWYYAIYANGTYTKTLDKYKATHRHIRLYRRGKLYRDYYEPFNLTMEANDLPWDWKVESERG